MPNYSDLYPSWYQSSNGPSVQHSEKAAMARTLIGYQTNKRYIPLQMAIENPPPPPPPPPPGPRPGPDDPRSNNAGSTLSNLLNPQPGVTPRPRSDFDGKRVYALLIGIDHYDYVKPNGDTIHLAGCVNDSREVERYLKESVDQPEQRLFLRKLRSARAGNEEEVPGTIACASEEVFTATRENIIRSFREFLRMARKGDVVFIHYSGHGSFEFRPERLHHLSREDNVEHQGGTLVAQDTYTMDGDRMIEAISDLELRWLLHGISEQKPHIVSAMDCCYSTGNTRNVDDDGAVTRFAEPPSSRLNTPNTDNTRPFQTYTFYQTDPEIWEIMNGDNFQKLELPLADRAVALHACRENELSKEDGFPEGRHGVFTYYFLQLLRATGGQISYRDLVKLIRAKVAGNTRISFQSPQIDASRAKDMNLSFLSGKLAPGATYYTVRPSSTDANLGIMDAGSIHGIASVEEGQTTVELYPSNVEIADANPADALKGVLTIVDAHESTVKLDNEQLFPEGTTFMKAVVTAAPLPATKVRLMQEAETDLSELADDSPEKLALAEGQQLLEAAIAESKYFQLVNTGEHFCIYTYLFDGEEKYRITSKGDIAALVEPVVGFNEDSAELIVAQMDHIARWEKTLNLEKTQYPIIQPGDVELLAVDPGTGAEIESNNGEVILQQVQQADGSWTKPQIKVKINMKKEDGFYHAALLQLKRTFAIDTQQYLPSGAILGIKKWIEEGRERSEGRRSWFAVQEFIDANGTKRTFPTGLPINFSVDDPENLLERGISEVEEHFKLIVSTAEFDAFYLDQKGIELATTTRDVPDTAPKNQLEALMLEASFATRGDIVLPDDVVAANSVSDWFTTTLTVKTVLVPLAD